jgi:hypothetical protein
VPGVRRRPPGGGRGRLRPGPELLPLGHLPLGGKRRLLRGEHRRHEEVPRVWVGVEEAVLEDLLQVGVQQAPSYLRPRDAGRLDAFVVRDLDRPDVLECQHPTRGVAPDHFRHQDFRPLLEGGGKPFGVLPLVEVVHLLVQGAAELLQEPRHVDVTAHGLQPLEPGSDQAQRRQVRLHDLLDVRALHFDHHFGAGPPIGAALAQAGGVSLADGRGGDGHGVQLQESLLQGDPELRLYDAPDLLEGFRPHLVLKARELARELPG